MKYVYGTILTQTTAQQTMMLPISSLGQAREDSPCSCRLTTVPAGDTLAATQSAQQVTINDCTFILRVDIFQSFPVEPHKLNRAITRAIRLNERSNHPPTRGQAFKFTAPRV